MTFYIIFFSLMIFLCLFSNLGLKNRSNKSIAVYGIYHISVIYFAFTLFLITALRYNVGTDYIAYQIYAKENIIGIPFFLALKKSEFFFVLFSKLSYSIFGNMQLLYVILAVFTYFFLIKGILYYEKNLILPATIFFISTCFFISLNTMRQFCACSIFIYATRFINKREFKKYVYCILLAFCWHTSSLIFIPCYFFSNIKIKKSFFVFIIGIFFLKKLLNIFISNFLSNIGINLNYYFLIQEGASSKSFIIISFFILFYFYFFVKRDFSVISNLFFNLSLIEFLISVFADGIPGSYRLVYLFYPCYIVICPYLLRKSKNKALGKFFILTILSMFAFYFYSQQILGNANEVVPYQSILGKN